MVDGTTIVQKLKEFSVGAHAPDPLSYTAGILAGAEMMRDAPEYMQALLEQAYANGLSRVGNDGGGVESLARILPMEATT